MHRGPFWLRWSWRDLKGRWLLVVAIALVLAIGTGIYSGLGSLENWRKASNDASFAALNAHDLKITMTEGSRAPAGTLRKVVESLPAADQVSAVSERLILPTQFEIARPGQGPLVTGGQIVGSQLGPHGPPVDGVAAESGRGLRGGDSGQPIAVLDASYGTPARSASSGHAPGRRREDAAIRRAGALARSTSSSPGPAGGDFGGAEASFAVVFTSLETAQRIAGGAPSVNDAVLTLRPGADQALVRRQLEAALARSVPGTEVTTLADEPAHRILYKDAEGDQQMFEIFAYLILAGAAFAAFNLASRIVEAQRREIGIGMALGVPPRGARDPPAAAGRGDRRRRGPSSASRSGCSPEMCSAGALEDLLPLPVMRDAVRAPRLRQGSAGGAAAAPGGDGDTRLARRAGATDRRDPGRLPLRRLQRARRAREAAPCPRIRASCRCRSATCCERRGGPC